MRFLSRGRRFAAAGVVVAGTALLAGPLAAAPSSAASSGITDAIRFTPATVVDPVLFGGEPGVNVDPTLVSGKRSFVDWPVSSRQNIGVLFRSGDGALSYTKRYAQYDDPAQAGPACIGRQTPFCPAGGGGDTDVNINAGNGTVYMSSQESLANQAVGASFNHGTTFPASNVDPVAAGFAGDVDRQWLSNWKGTKTVFLAFHSPIVGEFIERSDQSGATGSWYNPSAAGANKPQITEVTQSGSMVADNTGGRNNHALYIGYLATGLTSNLSGFAVGVSTDGAKTFQTHKVPGGDNARNFTKVFLDNVGNLYATWTDSRNQKTYLTTSLASDPANVGHPATKWSQPVVVSPAGLHVTIFPDVVSGSPGRIAVSYYGTTDNADTPDDVQPGGPGWYPFASVSLNALCQWNATPCAAPTFSTSHISHRVNQNDNICTSGTACAATGGNRNLLDYFDVSLDLQGHLQYVWSDGNNATKLPFVKVSRQASGPSLYVGKPAAYQPVRGNGYADPGGDARYPIMGALVNTAANKKKLDLTGTSVQRVGTNLVFKLRLADPTHLGASVPGGGTGADGATPLQQTKYLIRWDFGHNSYYAGANVTAGNDTPAFFSGTVSQSEALLAAGGGTTAYGNTYQPLSPASGTLTSFGLEVSVPVSAVGSPAAGAKLFSVGGYALLGPNDRGAVLNTAPITIDSTPTFDTTVG